MQPYRLRLSSRLLPHSLFGLAESKSLFFFRAFLQQLRKPNSLKNYLGQIRVILGPPYVIAMACTCIKEGFTPVPVVRFVASFLASTVFRPDNTATLETFKMGQMFSSKSRRIIHGMLMTSSAVLLNVQLVFIILVLYLYGKFNDQIWAVFIAFRNFLSKSVAWAQIYIQVILAQLNWKQKMSIFYVYII